MSILLSQRDELLMKTLLLNYSNIHMYCNIHMHCIYRRWHEFRLKIDNHIPQPPLETQIAGSL